MCKTLILKLVGDKKDEQTTVAAAAAQTNAKNDGETARKMIIVCMFYRLHNTETRFTIGGNVLHPHNCFSHNQFNWCRSVAGFNEVAKWKMMVMIEGDYTKTTVTKMEIEEEKSKTHNCMWLSFVVGQIRDNCGQCGSGVGHIPVTVTW